MALITFFGETQKVKADTHSVQMPWICSSPLQPCENPLLGGAL